ncbi:MAG: ABC transporter substrate-binding protein [Ginsengibacter sp.]
MWAIHQLYNTLVEVDSNLHIIPSLARSWEVSDDNLTFTFHLRTDVYFQDSEIFPGGKGRKMVAGDVVYSLERIMEKATASSGAWIFNDKIALVNGFNALDDSTFQLKLKRPFHPILGILSMQYCSIVAKEAVIKYGKDFRSHPCGTGPFQMLAWDEGQSLIFKKNRHYFEKDSLGVRLPYLDGIKISFYGNKATEFLQFQQKKLEFIQDIDPSFKDEVLTKNGQLKKEWKGNINMIRQPFLNVEYLGILQDTNNLLVKNSPLRNQKIRQAINYAIDRRKMIVYLRNGLGNAAESGFVPMGLPSFDANRVEGYHYDPIKASTLLKEAGYPNGEGLPVIKLLTISLYADLGSFIANQLRQVGINIQVEVIQKSLLIEETSRSAALFFRGSWIADYPDSENYLSVFYSHNPAPPNYTRYANNEFDRLYESALEEKNDSVRTKIYQKADQLVIKDAPIVPLWYDMVVRLVHTYVINFKTNSLNSLELRSIRLNK